MRQAGKTRYYAQQSRFAWQIVKTGAKVYFAGRNYSFTAEWINGVFIVSPIQEKYGKYKPTYYWYDEVLEMDENELNNVLELLHKRGVNL